MGRFSCFLSRDHSPKQKVGSLSHLGASFFLFHSLFIDLLLIICVHFFYKMTKLPTEAMKKTLEDTFLSSVLKDKQCQKDEVEMNFSGADNGIDSSPSERDCRSEDMNRKYYSHYDVEAQKNTQIKKSQSLGSGMNWKETDSCGKCSENEMERKFSYDGSSDGRVIVVSDGIDDHVLSLYEQCQERRPYDSAANSDFTGNISVFCIGDSQISEKGGADRNDLHFSGGNATDCHTPQTPRAIVKSSSLPCMASPSQQLTSALHFSRSTGDLRNLDSGNNGVPIHDAGEHVNLAIDYAENLADDLDESYNDVGYAKDWIIPVSEGDNTEKNKTGESYFHRWDEIPSKDLRLKRIEEWVFDLQQFSMLKEESNQFSSCKDHELPKSDALLEECTAKKLEVKVNPGMEAAKRYISSLNVSANAAQLTNLGLAVIPFLSPFISLKALNLSGNSIVRITAGALPRGLQILNLSKNSITSIEGLRDLTRLRIIDLSFNRLLRIGHGLASCSSLKELHLAGNKISEVEGLHRLLKLNFLDLRFNKICTTKCLGQLAANHGSLQALSLEGNPAQKNVGDEQLKKYVQSLLPHLSCYNRQSIKVGAMKDITADRSARLGTSSHQIDRGLRAELKTVRKGGHGITAQKAPLLSVHGRKHQATPSQKSSRTRQVCLPPTGVRTTQWPHTVDFNNKRVSSKNESVMSRSQSEGTLDAS